MADNKELPLETPAQTRPKGLTDQEWLLIVEFSACKNKRRALEKAGYPKHYLHILEQPHIRIALAAEVKGQIARARKTADEVIKACEDVIFSDIEDLISVGADGQIRLKPLDEIPDDKKALIQGLTIRKDGVIDLKTPDKGVYMRLLMTAHGLLTDRVEHVTEDNVLHKMYAVAMARNHIAEAVAGAIITDVQRQIELMPRATRNMAPKEDE